MSDQDCTICGWGRTGCCEEETGCYKSNRIAEESLCCQAAPSKDKTVWKKIDIEDVRDDPDALFDRIMEAAEG